jgi:hypothetical protein
MYGLHSRSRVFLSKQKKVADNNKDTSLLRNLSIFHTLPIRNFYSTGLLDVMLNARINYHSQSCDLNNLIKTIIFFIR